MKTGKEYADEKLDEIAEKMIVFLKKQENGYDTTTAIMAREMGYPDLSFEDLMNLNMKVFELAEKNGIVLDMSKHEGLFEGLPFNLDFVLRK